ncbi:hypothetical protein GNY06_02920 [Elizabethkingia argentiflava]|uniref:Mobilization protein n=1 Tax=Elizabethkingia argenteiflava TaxID=2681556 RepID=A0A845PRU3_9FLAO|nr:hypothetical protein [Elizabethkingia argenteiflava]NAW50385.1 hypothetical protein [Elizabethkingia argenteiflava]
MIEPLKIENTLEAEAEIINISEFKISPDVEIEKPTPILSVKQKGKFVDIFTEGNISMLFGLAKSRKSTFLKSIVQAILSGENTKMYSDYERNEIAIVDTEQSLYDSYRATKVIQALTGYSIDYYNVAELKRSQRKYLVEEHLKSNPNCGFMILDNIVHFLVDFNDTTESAELLQWLIMLKVKYNVHLCLVLHENSSEGSRGKARGHLGTNLEQMCETIIQIKKDQNDHTRSIVTPKMMRGIEFEPFAITQDYQGIPYLSDLENEYFETTKLL